MLWVTMKFLQVEVQNQLESTQIKVSMNKGGSSHLVAVLSLPLSFSLFAGGYVIIKNKIPELVVPSLEGFEVG